MADIPNLVESTFSNASASSEYKLRLASERLKEKQSKFKADIDDNVIRETVKSAVTNIDNPKLVKKHMKLIEDYVKENSLSPSDIKKLEKIRSEFKDLEKAASEKNKASQENEQFSLSGLSKAFGQGGLKGAFGFGKDTLKTGAKEAMKLSNLVKGGIHAAGVALDIPALNILASEIGSSNRDTTEVDTLTNLQTAISNADKTGEKKIKEDEKVEKKESTVDSTEPSSGKLDFKSQGGFDSSEIVDANLETAAQVEDTLFETKDINKNLISVNNKLSDLIFIIKDQRDDKLSTLTSPTVAGFAGIEDQKVSEEKENLFGDLDFGGLNSKNIKKSIPSSAVKGAGLVMAGVAGVMIGDMINEAFDQETLEQAATKRGGYLNLIKSAGQGLLNVLGFDTDEIELKGAAKGYEASQKFGSLKGAPDKKQEEFRKYLEDKDVIDLNTVGYSEIKDYKAIEALSPNQIDSLIQYGDWSEIDQMKLNRAKKASVKRNDMLTAAVSGSVSTLTSTKPITNIDKEIEKSSKTNQSAIPDGFADDLANKIGTKIVEAQSVQAPIVVPAGSTTAPSKVNNYDIEDNDLMYVMTGRGIRN